MRATADIQQRFHNLQRCNADVVDENVEGLLGFCEDLVHELEARDREIEDLRGQLPVARVVD